MAQSRGYFVSAYRGEGWIFPEAPDVSSQERWMTALEASGDQTVAALEETPDEWLRRKIDLIDTEGTVTAWRLLMMMVEHDVHHRSQIDTYAGLNGWDRRRSTIGRSRTWRRGRRRRRSGIGRGRGQKGRIACRRRGGRAKVDTLGSIHWDRRQRGRGRRLTGIAGSR